MIDFRYINLLGRKSCFDAIGKLISNPWVTDDALDWRVKADVLLANHIIEHSHKENPSTPAH